MMKRLFNTSLLLFIVTLFVNAQNGSVGKFVTVFQKNGHEATMSTDGISFIKDEQVKRYAWQPIEWQKSDYLSQGEAFDIKNVKSIFRSVESDNRFTVTIPAGAPVDKNEIIVQAYGKEITTTDGSQYTTGANAISVVNKDGNILYDCYASVDTLDAQRTIELNALETAYTLLLPIFPSVFEPTSDEILEILKSLLAELPETHALASAIDQSIVKNGYFDINDVEAEYQAAIDRIIEKMGLRNNYLKSSMNNAAKRAIPSKKPYIINGNGVYGYKLVMNSSEWVENDLGKTWICNLTAYNSNRFAYTAWVRGFKDSDGGIHYYDFSYDQLRKSLLKPQRVSTFMGTFTDPVTKPFKRDSWDGIADYFSDSYKLFFEEGFGFDDMTWDNTKKTFDMSFFTSNDVVIVAGPAENDLMMYYNILKTIIDPIIKKVAKKLTGAEDEDYMLNFCISLVDDEDYRSDFANIFMSNKTFAIKAKEILILTWPKMRKYLDEFFYEQVKTKSLQFIWDHWGFTAAGEFQKALDNIDGTEANWNKWLKTVEKVGDVTLGVIGLTEGSYYYDVALDFDDDIVAYTSCPDSHHPHLIDLGLPSGTKWACCNVGAEKPEDYGGYFAWGETAEKSSCTSDNYLDGKGTSYDIGKDISGTQYDAATANWGSPWVMPSKEQMDELENNCTSEWTTENGVNGRRFNGPNGASIFLPAAGARWRDDLSNAGSYGYYWSSSLNESNTSNAWILFAGGYMGKSRGDRETGRSVRPVRKN